MHRNELEERYSVDYTSAILASNPEERQTIVRDLTHAIQQCDQALLLQSASDMEYLCTIANVVKWRKLWDHALDHGERGITSVRNLVRVISHPRHAPSLCPLSDVKELTTPLPIHVLKNHTNSSEYWDTLFNSILHLFLTPSHVSKDSSNSLFILFSTSISVFFVVCPAGPLLLLLLH